MFDPLDEDFSPWVYEEYDYDWSKIMHKRFEDDVWTCGNEEVVLLKEMSKLHIKNSISFIENGASIYGLADKWLPKLKKELESRR